MRNRKSVNIKRKTIALEEALTAISIDFEGKKIVNGKVPDQLLLGAWGPFGIKGQYQYQGWIIHPMLKPITKCSALNAELEFCTIETALNAILEKAEEYNSLISCYSEHEIKVIRAKAPTFEEEVLEKLVNIRQIAKSAAKHKGVYQKPFSLDKALTAMSVRNIDKSQLRYKMAQYDTDLIKAGETSKRWGNWKSHQKEKAIELVKYNKADVKNSWKLLKKSCMVNELHESR